MKSCTFKNVVQFPKCTSQYYTNILSAKFMSKAAFVDPTKDANSKQKKSESRSRENTFSRHFHSLIINTVVAVVAAAAASVL